MINRHHLLSLKKPLYSGCKTVAMTIFKLKEEYIELIKLLKAEGVAESGAHAKLMVESGEVVLNGEPESRKRAKLRDGDVVEVAGQTIKIAAA